MTSPLLSYSRWVTCPQYWFPYLKGEACSSSQGGCEHGARCGHAGQDQGADVSASLTSVLCPLRGQQHCSMDAQWMIVLQNLDDWARGQWHRNNPWSLMIMTSSKRVSLATQPHCSASPMYCYYWCNNNSCVTGVWIFLCFVLFLHSLQYSPSRMTICSPEWGPCLPDVQPRLVGSWCRVAVMSTSGLIRVPLMVPEQHFSSPLGTFPDAF